MMLGIVTPKVDYYYNLTKDKGYIIVNIIDDEVFFYDDNGKKAFFSLDDKEIANTFDIILH